MSGLSHLLEVSFTWAAFKLQIDDYSEYFNLSVNQTQFLYNCFKDPYWLYLHFPFAMVFSKSMSHGVPPILLPYYIHSVLGPVIWPLGFESWRRDVLDFQLIDYSLDDVSFEF